MSRTQIIGLNLLHALPEIGGGWNYIQNLMVGLGEFGGAYTYVAFVNKSSVALVPRKDNFRIVVIPLDCRSRVLRIGFENTVLQILAKLYGVHCMHWFSSTMGVANTVPSVVTVYDLQVFSEYMNHTKLIKRLYLQAMIRRVGRRADMLLPISALTAGDLHAYTAARQDRIRVIPPILGPEYSVASADAVVAFRQKYRLPDKFWIYVAHLYPHKNHVNLFRAYHLLKQDGTRPWKLVLRGNPAGAEDDVHACIRELGLANDIIWLPRLETAEMAKLYSAASGLVFPSSYEGAGIPVLEALGCGCPVISANLPSVREFVAEVVTYFDSKDPVAIADAMRNFQQNVSVEDLRSKGIERAAQFRAQYVIPFLLESYQDACDS